MVRRFSYQYLDQRCIFFYVEKSFGLSNYATKERNFNFPLHWYVPIADGKFTKKLGAALKGVNP